MNSCVFYYLLIVVLVNNIKCNQDLYEEHYEYDHEPPEDEEAYEEEPLHHRNIREAPDEYYEDEPYEEYEPKRYRREVVYEPFEYVRVKRCEYEPEYRVKRSAQQPPRRRRAKQYQVREAMEDDVQPSTPPYEELLAASADHYHTYYEPRMAQAGRYVSSAPKFQARPPTTPIHLLHPTLRVNPQSFYPPSYVNVSPAMQDRVQVPLARNPFVPNYHATVDSSHAPSRTRARHHATHQQLKHGGGLKHIQHLNSDHADKSSQGSSDSSYKENANKGSNLNEDHKKQYEVLDGKKSKHEDHADHKGAHDEEAHGHRGAKFNEKKGHKKGHKTKGYHNKYHKDEFHKEHKFYDDYHKSGHHHRYGKFNAKHQANEGGKKKAHHMHSSHDEKEHGKKGITKKGHTDSDQKGHSGKQGHEDSYQHEQKYGKKGASSNGKDWGFSKKQ